MAAAKKGGLGKGLDSLITDKVGTGKAISSRKTVEKKRSESCRRNTC